MTEFRKKPVVIEAWQFDAPKFMPQPSWLRDAITSGKIYYQGGNVPYYTIETLEGKMKASEGDWIIRGVKGEIYPCKPDIFAATYEHRRAMTPPSREELPSETLFIERSKVRGIIIGSRTLNCVESESLLRQIDALPIFPEDMCGVAQAPPLPEPFLWVCIVPGRWSPEQIRSWTRDPEQAARWADDGLDMKPLYAAPSHATPQEVQEACAQVADRMAERKHEDGYDTSAEVARRIAASIRALIPPTTVSSTPRGDEK
jgi:hypothetical protein